MTAPQLMHPGALRGAPAPGQAASRAQAGLGGQLYIPLRTDPSQQDGRDDERVELVMRRHRSQDAAYLSFARTVESHIRMLSGRQWDQWSPLHGRFIDLRQFMSPDERKHRMQPVMDYLGYWYLLTLAKATENEPLLNFQPASADRRDAMLAEVMEPIWKTLSEQMELSERIIQCVGWQLAAGLGYFATRVDFQCGKKRQLIAPAVLRLDRPGASPIERLASAVPYGADGNPLAQLVPDPDNPDDYGYEVTGEPYEDLEGEPKLDVPCPLQIRAQWGQHIPWRDKRWIQHEWWLTPEQCYEQFGVELAADHYAGFDEGGGNYLERMLFGAGYYGPAASALPIASGSGTSAKDVEGYVHGITMWEKPIRGLSDETDDSPGGRLLVVAPGSSRVLWDSLRPFRTECAGPIRRVAFFDLPGRPLGSTVLEKIVPLQRRLNRLEAHISEHTNLCADPILMLHEAAGIDADNFRARPGMVITHGYNGSGRAGEYLTPPPLSADVWKHKNDVREQIFVIGAMAGNQSQTPTATASGELVEQLRVNADRPLTPLTRNLTLALAGVAMDMQAILPTIWTDEKVITYSGEDNVARTVTVLPEMFSGRVNVRPSIEAMAADSKDARRGRIIQLYQLGAFGSLMDPAQQQKANSMLLSLLQFPELTRATRPGGVDRIMAEVNLGRLVQGDLAADIPLLEVYDYGVHLGVIEGYMKAPEYLQQDLTVQTQLTLFREAILAAQQTQMMNQLARQIPQASAMAAAQGTVAQVTAASSPAPAGPDGKPGGPGGPGSPAPGTSPGASPSAPRPMRAAS